MDIKIEFANNLTSEMIRYIKDKIKNWIILFQQQDLS